MATPLHSAQSR